MNINSLEFIAVVLFLLILLVATLIVLYEKVFPIIDTKLELESRRIKNEKYNIFLNTDPEMIDKYIDEYIKKQVNRYITYKFIANKVNYIKQNDIEDMVKDLTKSIYLEISELYVYYLQMMYSIDNDDDLLTRINSLVKTITIESVSAYNNAELI